MKRLAIVLGSVMLVAAVAYPVLAWGPGWVRGHHMMGYSGAGPGYAWQSGRGYGNLTEEQRTQLDMLYRKFFDETATLRNEIWTKSGELNALLNSSNPDREKVKSLQKELSDLEAKIAQRRLDLALDARKMVPEGGFAPGWGMGYGMMRPGWGMGPGMMGPGFGRGFGPGPCWN